MKPILLIFLSLCLAACASNPTAKGSAPLVKVTDASAADLIGKRLEQGYNYIVLSEDGTMKGTWAGGRAVGVWEMKDGLWCRKFTTFPIPDFVNVEACHLWEREADTIKATRRGGKGTTYKLKIVS